MLIKSLRFEHSDTGIFETCFSEGLNILVGNNSRDAAFFLPYLYATLYTASLSAGQYILNDCGLCGKYIGDFRDAMPYSGNNKEYLIKIKIMDESDCPYSLSCEKKPHGAVFIDVNNDQSGEVISGRALHDILKPLPAIIKVSNWNLGLGALFKIYAGIVSPAAGTSKKLVRVTKYCLCNEMADGSANYTKGISPGLASLNYMQLWADMARAELRGLKGFVSIIEPFSYLDKPSRIIAANILKSLAGLQMFVAVNDYDERLLPDGLRIDVA